MNAYAFSREKLPSDDVDSQHTSGKFQTKLRYGILRNLSASTRVYTDSSITPNHNFSKKKSHPNSKQPHFHQYGKNLASDCLPSMGYVFSICQQNQLLNIFQFHKCTIAFTGLTIISAYFQSKNNHFATICNAKPLLTLWPKKNFLIYSIEHLLTLYTFITFFKYLTHTS